jgi:hypothetical protein
MGDLGGCAGKLTKKNSIQYKQTTTLKPTYRASSRLQSIISLFQPVYHLMGDISHMACSGGIGTFVDFVKKLFDMDFFGK